MAENTWPRPRWPVRRAAAQPITLSTRVATTTAGVLPATIVP